MSIGVIGVGVVGRAVYQAFTEKLPSEMTYGYDKFNKEFNDLPLIASSELIFVCVPTPTKGEWQDTQALVQTFGMLKEMNYKGVVVVKSTVLPGVTEKLMDQFSMPNVVHNPEFLTANNAYEDFLKQPVLIGGKMSAMRIVSDAYRRANIGGPVNCYSSPSITEMAKYMHNLFLATKVSFCNEIYDVCQEAKVNYEMVAHAAQMAGKIGTSHMMVPGPDGERGFGGMCFLKDNAAFLAYADQMEVEMDILQATISGNKRRRSDSTCL